MRHLPTINGVGRASGLHTAAPCGACCAAVESRVLRTAYKADVWAWARCEVAPASVEALRHGSAVAFVEDATVRVIVNARGLGRCGCM